MIKLGLIFIVGGIWTFWGASGFLAGFGELVGIALVVAGVGILGKYIKMFSAEWRRTAPKDDEDGIEKGEEETK